MKKKINKDLEKFKLDKEEMEKRDGGNGGAQVTNDPGGTNDSCTDGDEGCCDSDMGLKFDPDKGLYAKGG